MRFCMQGLPKCKIFSRHLPNPPKGNSRVCHEQEKGGNCFLRAWIGTHRISGATQEFTAEN